MQHFDNIECRKKGEGRQRVSNIMPQKHCTNNIWLVKPANENQGKGIKIFNNTRDITRFIESSLQFSHWVI